MESLPLRPCLHRRSFAQPLRAKRGFTLIELMVVVAIAGLLAALAYPSLMRQVRQSRRSDALVAIMQIQNAQERWRANRSSYATSIDGAWPDTGLGLSTTTPNGYYTLSVASATGSGYTLTATAVLSRSQQYDSGCNILRAQVASGAVTYTPPNCWSW